MNNVLCALSMSSRRFEHYMDERIGYVIYLACTSCELQVYINLGNE